MPAKELSPTQAAEARELKALFVAWQRARKAAGEEFSQEVASESFSFGQSAMAQYLNGKIPLNPEAATQFANFLGHPIRAFSPTIANQIAGYGAQDSIPVDATHPSNVSALRPYQHKAIRQVLLSLWAASKVHSLERRSAVAGLVTDLLKNESDEKGARKLARTIESLLEQPSPPPHEVLAGNR